MIILLILNIFLNFFILNSNTLQSYLQKLVKKGPQKWMLEQINQDLNPYKKCGITRKLLDKTIIAKVDSLQRCHVRYKIKNNKLSILYIDDSVKKHPTVNGYFVFMNNIFKQLIELIKLPDVEFILFPSDGPGEADKYFAPVLSFCKLKNHTNVILVPDPQSFEYSFNGTLNQVDLGLTRYPWNKKKVKAFWRGASTGADFNHNNYKDVARVKLIELSKLHPQLLDAKFSTICQTTKEMEQEFIKLGYVDKHVSIAEHLQDRYQILIDGNTASWGRGYWQLFSNCVMFKQESPWILWYYNALKPFVHYIPFSYSLDNLILHLNWSIQNEQKVVRIINEANKFADQNLKFVDMLYYLYLVLVEYAKLQKFSV